MNPISVNFEITNLCNASCKFCSIKDQKKEKNIYDIDILKQLVDIFDENGLLKINLFGGEPLVYKKIVELSRYIKSKKFHLTLITNGLSLDDKLKELYRYIDIFGVSIHGLRETHDDLVGVDGAFDKIKSNMKLLKDNKCKFGINFTVTSSNYKQIVDTVDYLLVNGVDINFLSLNRYVENKYLDRKINDQLKINEKIINESLSYLEILHSKYPELSIKYAVSFPHCIVENKEHLKFLGRCGFGENYCAVDGAGNFKLCSWSETVLGNLFNEPMDKIWNNNTVKNYQSEVWMEETCKSCKDKRSCMSGCKLSSNIEPFSSDILITSGEKHEYANTI